LYWHFKGKKNDFDEIEPSTMGIVEIYHLGKFDEDML
jgi:hypothetical protein